MTLSSLARPGRLLWLAGALLLVPTLLAAQPLKVGETKSFRMTAADSERATEGGLVVEEAGAKFIWLHFAEVRLPGNSRIVVRGANGQSAVLTASQLQNGASWSDPIDGDSVVVAVEADSPGVSFVIDRYSYGTVDVSENLLQTESTFGADDKRDPECFPGTYKYANRTAVGRMLFTADTGGSFVCTGALISAQSHFLTNNHCVSTESEVDSLRVRFNFERTTCGGTTNKTFTTIGGNGNHLIRTNAGLDFTLLTLEGNPAATFGYLPLNGEDLKPGDPLYIVQHPGGDEKKIHARHTGTANEDCVVKDSDWSEPGYNANSSIQHTCDTEGGSSGSPVLNDNNQIVALHHTGYAGNPGLCSNNGGAGAPCNGAVEMEQILPLIQGDLPADHGGAGGTAGWVWYRSQETWRYQSGASERIWSFFLSTSATAWVDAKAQPTLAEMFNSAAQSGHWLGLFWTNASNWTNARLWYQ